MSRNSSRLALVVSCVCCASVIACGDPAPADSATATVTDGSDSDATAATEPTASAATVTDGSTNGETTVSTTDDEVTVTAGDPTTENLPTTGPDTTTIGDTTTTTGDDTTTTGGDTTTTTGDDTTTTGGDTTTTTGDTTDAVSTTEDDTTTTTGGDDPWDCAGGQPITVNEQGKYSTLAAAVAAAPPGATITVCPGTYQEGVVIDRPMTLLGAGQDKTFLDGGGTSTPILIDRVSVTIEGFTFRHGEAEHNPLGNSLCGGGLAINDSAEPMTVTVKDCTFTDNHGQFGGAICYDGNSNNDNAELVLESVSITGNSADLNGGGIFSYAPTTMTDTTIVENTAGNQGGGLYFSYCAVEMDGGAVKLNTADEGGGMFLQSPVTVDVTASDWGFGQAQENVPNDVQHYVNEYGFFGANVSFSCDYPVWNMGMCMLK
ncbi:hypothetical protein [Nannocystis radixulma]|uniref:Right handed beta helix domain-containing protein n=1 Tax=Nannocystis radixulma TaxID=2995305 RepID=A0ABT5B1P1_9BACT|nr:hypothetical protein [Nannocystis radixulma]MDC0668029.1 hypothetical protein [Nannocystis radixulma]